MRYSLPLGDHQACSEIRLRVAMPSYGRVVSVPIYGRAESLNLATAAAVCLYASARARLTG